jgi:hypothetical protein
MRRFNSVIGAGSTVALVLFASALTACSSPPQDAVRTTSLQSDVLSGCAMKALTATIPGMDPQLLKSCEDGSETIYAVAATIRTGDVVTFNAEPSPEIPAPAVASGLLVDDEALATATGIAVTATHPGTVAVSGFGPLYCDEVVNPGAILSTSNPKDVAGLTCLLLTLTIRS